MAGNSNLRFLSQQHNSVILVDEEKCYLPESSFHKDRNWMVWILYVSCYEWSGLKTGWMPYHKQYICEAFHLKKTKINKKYVKIQLTSPPKEPVFVSVFMYTKARHQPAFFPSKKHIKLDPIMSFTSSSFSQVASKKKSAAASSLLPPSWYIVSENNQRHLPLGHCFIESILEPTSSPSRTITLILFL